MNNYKTYKNETKLPSVFYLPRLESKFLINPDYPYEQRGTRRLNTLKQKILNHITFHLSENPLQTLFIGTVRMNPSWSQSKILMLSCFTVKALPIAGNFGQKIQKLPDKNSKNQLIIFLELEPASFAMIKIQTFC